jgi:replicative DNA helicase
MPEQQLLGTLTPALSIADIARTGQQLGAQTMSAAGISGLEDILQAESLRSQNLRDLYSTILGAQANQQAANTAAAGTAATNTGLFSSIGGIVDAFKKIF